MPSLRTKKMLKTIADNHGDISEYFASLGRKNAGKPKPTAGFGSEIIGKDGLTGRERAIQAGRKGGNKKKRNFSL